MSRNCSDQDKFGSLSSNGTCFHNSSIIESSVHQAHGDRADLIRDLTLNLFTVTFHVIAFLFILLSKCVQPSLRIFLMSLSLPGFIQNLSWGIVRIDTLWFRQPLIARESGCKLLHFISQIAILSGQTTVSGLTINNYLAVSFPILFKSLMTPIKTLFCVIFVWAFWAVFNIGDIFLSVDNEKPCLSLLVTSTYVLLAEALVILLTCITVTTLNLKLVFHIWGKIKVHPTDSEMPMDNTIGRSDDASRVSGLSKMQNGSIIFSIADEPTASQMVFTTNSYQDNPNHDKYKQICLPKMFVPCSARHLRQIHDLDTQIRTSDHRQVRFNVASPNRLSTILNSKILHHNRTRRPRSSVRKMAVTLIVLTIWNSVAYLPFMVCLIMAVAERDEKVSPSLKLVSDVGGLIIRLSAIGNTFIYAWRFIRWGPVCSKMQHRCPCCA